MKETRLKLVLKSQDNRDAEAFLKPVSKAEVPDYYECTYLWFPLRSDSNSATVVISNPMDFQSMLRKVKQKSYRSKREFQDDLDLIWSNCYTYNASEVRIWLSPKSSMS
jgi:transcriptional activator SPT7